MAAIYSKLSTDEIIALHKRDKKLIKEAKEEGIEEGEERGIEKGRKEERKRGVCYKPYI